MVWIFNNTNKSVFAIILFHTMINISPYLFPSNGSHYDPFIFAVLLAITAILFTNHPNNMKTRIAYILLMLANSSYIKKTYGLKFYQEFKLIANEKLEEISQKIPDIGNSIFSINYAFMTAYVPFFYAFGQFAETKDKAGELLWLINENLLRIIPVFIWRIAGRIAISKRNVKILKNIQKQGELGLMHPMDWRIEVIEHSDRSHSCYMKECGALKVLRELGEDSIFPYACRIDYLMANLMGIKFERDKTLADGDDYCNNHILGSGFTEWSPEKGFELRK